MANKSTVTIRVKVETKKRLDEIGKKGDTYDDIIRRLLEYYEKSNKN